MRGDRRRRGVGTARLIRGAMGRFVIADTRPVIRLVQAET